MKKAPSTTIPPRGCQHQHTDGRICAAYAVKGTEFCVGHTNKQRASVQGNVGTHKEKAVMNLLESEDWSLSSLSQLMRLLIKEVYKGNLDASTAHAVTALANISIRATEKANIETRLDELESRYLKGAYHSGGCIQREFL